MSRRPSPSRPAAACYTSLLPAGRPFNCICVVVDRQSHYGPTRHRRGRVLRCPLRAHQFSNYGAVAHAACAAAAGCHDYGDALVTSPRARGGCDRRPPPEYESWTGAPPPRTSAPHAPTSVGQWRLPQGKTPQRMPPCEEFGPTVRYQGCFFVQKITFVLRKISKNCCHQRCTF